MSIETNSPQAEPAFAGLDPAKARTIDDICDCFEHQLYTRNAMAIEGLLAGFGEPERSVLLRELLFLELERTVSGDVRPSLERYFQRFPQHTSIVQEVFAELFPPAAQPPPVDRAALPTIPNYRILRELSQGGMGAVYEAMHTELGNLVAIKVLRAELVKDLQAEVRFKREMKVIGTLSHPHIVQARDAGKAGATHYLVMEYLVGFDLADLVQRLGPLPVPDACEIARRVALALAHAHQQQLVHRDIKPKNVLFGRTSGGDEPVQVKVADFGLALLRGFPRPHDPAVPGSIVGTLGFMAPEQYWEQASNTRSDIYSLGCTLYYLLLSRPPFSRMQYPETVQLMDAHRSAAVPPLRRLRPDVSESLEGVILAMLAKDPRDRPQSPADVAEQLQPFTAGHNLDQLLSDAEDSGDAPEAGGATAGPPLDAQVSQTRSWVQTPFAASETTFEPVSAAVDQPLTTASPVAKPQVTETARSPLDAAWMAVPFVLLLLALGVAWLWLGNKPEPIDLLKQVDPARDAVSGQWQIRHGVLSSPGEPFARLVLPQDVPAAYKLEIEAKRESGGRLAIGLVRDGRQLPIILDSAVLGGEPEEDRPTDQQFRELAVKLGFAGGPANTYTAIVHPEGLLVAFEDRIQVALHPGEDPASSAEWQTPSGDTLFIGTHYSVYHFHKITLTPIQP